MNGGALAAARLARALRLRHNRRELPLKEDTDRADECRILTNARCLSEGVDVPALDAIMFLRPRKSQIDVVQAVGRVMRRAEGKRMGYIILPVGVPAGVEPETALDNNEKYRVVWQILNALRSHDERLDATINKIDLGVDSGDRIEVIAVTNRLRERAEPRPKGIGIGQGGGAGDHEPGDEPRQPRAGEERPCFIDSCPADWQELPHPEGRIVVGLDGGYVRDWSAKTSNFEVIVDRSMPEDRGARHLGLVHGYDEKRLDARRWAHPELESSLICHNVPSEGWGEGFHAPISQIGFLPRRPGAG